MHNTGIVSHKPSYKNIADFAISRESDLLIKILFIILPVSYAAFCRINAAIAKEIRKTCLLSCGRPRGRLVCSSLQSDNYIFIYRPIVSEHCTAQSRKKEEILSRLCRYADWWSRQMLFPCEGFSMWGFCKLFHFIIA